MRGTTKRASSGAKKKRITKVRRSAETAEVSRRAKAKVSSLKTGSARGGARVVSVRAVAVKRQAPRRGAQQSRSTSAH